MALILFLAPSLSQGRVVVEGIADRQVTNGPVRLRVYTTENEHAKYWLDEQRIPPSTWFDVVQPGYHELKSMEQSSGGNVGQTQTVRFVIQSARGSTEWALPPWTPRPTVASGKTLIADNKSTLKLQVTIPARFPVGLPVPILAAITNQDNRRMHYNGRLNVVTSAGKPVVIKRGVGSGLIEIAKSGTLSLAAGPLTTEQTVSIFDANWKAVGGGITNPVIWGENSCIHVTSNLTIEKGASLLIRKGSVIKLAPKVEVTVFGKLTIEGTKQAPICFCPQSQENPWGGFTLKGGKASVEARWAFVTGSGGNPWWFAANGIPGIHRQEQAAFFLGEGCRGDFSDCFLVDNFGQAFHGESAQLALTRCVIQRCQTVGQFNGGSVKIHDSVLTDFPEDSAAYEDGDNDALYFTLGEHEIVGSLIGWCKDDGIDAGGDSPGTVTVSGCWFESCFHEGMALSGTAKKVRITDSVFINCGQGVETGYLSPEVSVEHCFMTGNGVGARFGDNYGRAQDGFLSLSNSISIFNQRDVWGMSRDIWEEKLSRMKVEQCYLTRPSDLFPNDQLWQPAEHGPFLVSFLSRSAFVPGIGFMTWDHSIAPSRITVGLSRPAVQPVRVQFVVREVNENETPGKTFVRDELVFQLGEVAREISLRIPGIEAAAQFEVSLSRPVNGELTGLSSLQFRTPKATATQKWVATKSAHWKWLKGLKEASVPRDAWRKQGFNDSAWTVGNAPFGYGREGVQTVLGDMRNNYTSVYLRHEFELESPDTPDLLRLQATYDDGFVLWINGSEVARVGVQTGEFPFNGRASESDYAPREWSAVVSPEKIPALLPGKNMVAVHLLNTRPDSTDLFFDLEMTTSHSSDMDQDGLPDEWEQRVIRANSEDAITTIIDVLPDEDFDGDGLGNSQEFAAATDPVNPFSALQLSMVRDSPVAPSLQWRAMPHRAYQIEVKDRLFAPEPWEELQLFPPVVEPVPVTRIFSLEAIHKPTGFFRLILQANP